MPQSPPAGLKKRDGKLWMWLLGLGIGAALVGPTILYRTTFDPDKGRPPELREGAVYPTHGMVESIDVRNRRIMIAHDEIPDVMPAMTMPFIVSDETELDGLAPGDHVEFSFRLRDRGAWIETIEKESPDAHASEAVH